jgi:hypothetical protein
VNGWTNTILVGKCEKTSSFGGPRHRWLNNIKMDVKEIEWDGLD